MLRIGLTGGIGSGKTAVSNKLAELGAVVIDTDVIARQVLATAAVTQQVRMAFGDGVVLDDGSVDRKALAAIVFSDASRKQQLEAILHPAIRAECLRQADKLEKDRADIHAQKITQNQVLPDTPVTSAPYLVFVVPLLFETDFHELVDRVLVVTASTAHRLERVAQRDGRDRAEIAAIMNMQVDEDSRLQAADDIIVNDADLDSLYQQVETLHQQYLSASGNET